MGVFLHKCNWKAKIDAEEKGEWIVAASGLISPMYLNIIADYNSIYVVQLWEIGQGNRDEKGD